MHENINIQIPAVVVLKFSGLQIPLQACKRRAFICRTNW
jgi:hypothetical protein